MPIYRIYALKYVENSRIWQSHGLRLHIPAGVFHPGIYFSTPIFLDFLQAIPLQGKTVLDMGTGSGALALFAAKKKAQVTAADIHPLAVETAQKNAQNMGLSLTVLLSDLFNEVPPYPFDYVLANPPYYPHNPKNNTEAAFFAGENLHYFERFFSKAGLFLQKNGIIYMILSEDCNWPLIEQYADQSGFASSIAYERKHWGERLFVAAFEVNP